MTRLPEIRNDTTAEVFVGGGELGDLCRALSWEDTALGPVEHWPQALRTAAGMVVAAPSPMLLLWGPELVQIYNQGASDLMGRRNPGGLGRPLRENWPELWERNADIHGAVLERGEVAWFENRRFVLYRHGFAEEAFFTFGCSPVPDGRGGVGGVLVTAFETTEQVLGRDSRLAGERLDAELEGERARSALALEASQLGDWELDLRSQESPRRSPRHDEIFGYPARRPDWSFEIFLEHVHPEDRATVQAAFETAVERHEPWDFECRIIRADGVVRWIWARGQGKHDADGELVRMLGVVADVTERKRAQESLQRYAEQLRGLANAAVAIHTVTAIPSMLDVITEQARHLIGAHQAVTSMTVGLDWAQAINSVSLSDKYAEWRTYDEMVDGSGIYRLVAQANRPMRLTQAELEAHPAWRGFGEHADRHPPMRGWLAVPLVARDGENIGLIQLSDRHEGDFSESDEAILVQLAHMAAIAIENVRLFQDVQQANRAKSEFLAAMSHELRTPLNAVGGYVELLEMGVHGPLTAAQHQALGRIGANQRHLLTLINDILSFARLEAGRIEIDLRPLAAHDLLTSLAALVTPQAEAKGVTYTVERCEPGLCLQGDAERVRQVLLNLVGNAVKFTPEGGWVTVACAGAGRWVEVRVRDNGMGIAPGEQEHIFDPFQQVGRRLNQPQAGVGLGLAISRDLARAMHGELSVQSEPGKGSTFTLRLPRAAEG
jgi:PAS domain S-box-containing protein